jgi:DNA-binding transcriptional LysR family regulator
VSYRVSSLESARILARVDADELDIGVLSLPKRMPQTLRITHRFDDAFTIVAGREAAESFDALPRLRKARLAWLSKQAWLLLEDSSNTGAALRAWVAAQGLEVEPTMELDSFDLLINLVSLGMGLSVVPIRALALYGRKHSLRRLRWEKRFVRELVVIVRKRRNAPEHIANFIDNILF